MIALTFVMTMLLGYQAFMPQVNNAKYSFAIDKNGEVIRMNTQNGAMERCDESLVCGD